MTTTPSLRHRIETAIETRQHTLDKATSYIDGLTACPSQRARESAHEAAQLCSVVHSQLAIVVALELRGEETIATEAVDLAFFLLAMANDALSASAFYIAHPEA